METLCLKVTRCGLFCVRTHGCTVGDAGLSTMVCDCKGVVWDPTFLSMFLHVHKFFAGAVCIIDLSHFMFLILLPSSSLPET